MLHGSGPNSRHQLVSFKNFDEILRFILCIYQKNFSITWEKVEKIKREVTTDRIVNQNIHAKFTNYSFDADEFVRLVRKAANCVYSYWRNNQKYKEFKIPSREIIDRDEL